MPRPCTLSGVVRMRLRLAPDRLAGARPAPLLLRDVGPSHLEAQRLDDRVGCHAVDRGALAAEHKLDRVRTGQQFYSIGVVASGSLCEPFDARLRPLAVDGGA